MRRCGGGGVRFVLHGRNRRCGRFGSEGGEEVRSAVEWAQVRAMAADGVAQREIARRLGINRRTVKRLAEASEPPRYERAPTGSMLDPLEPVIRGLLEGWPQIRAPRVAEILRDDYGYVGSVDLVRRRMAFMRPREVRVAQRTGYRPGQVMQIDWARDVDAPADRRSRAAGLRAGVRVALFGRVDGALHLRDDDRVVSGGPRAGVCVAGWRSARVRLRQPPFGGRQARRRRRDLESAVRAVARPLRVSCDGVHAADAAREGIGRGRGPLPQDRVLAGAAFRVVARAR